MQAKYLQHIGSTPLAPFPPPSAYNAKARATPDVAALGEGYQIVLNGKTSTIAGTSASAPAFAGLVSLWNEARLQAGKPALGFLNPMLYGLKAGLVGGREGEGEKKCSAAGFTDILIGTNAINLQGVPQKYGWNCTAGYDAATGLGTPDLSVLLNC